jgi:pyridoxamine 5'-phosphate oxidase
MSTFSASASSSGRDQLDDSDEPASSSADVVCEPWLSRIQRSITRSRKVKGGNYVQIATVDSSGYPSCRTVVFRGFADIAGTQYMRMITDARSEKVSHVQIQPKCELVWWFSQSSEQYRVLGSIKLVGEGDQGASRSTAPQRRAGDQVL